MTLEARVQSVPATLGAGVLVGILVFLFNLPFAQNTLFFDDAADYIRAADAGFLATWLNTNSASPVELIHLRREETFRAHPWDYLYMHADNTALRHFHGPLSYFAEHFARAISDSSQPERLLTSVISSLTCAGIVLALVDFSVPLSLATLLALLAGVQTRYIEASVDPTPHTWYMLFAFACLFFFARYLITKKDRELYFATVAFSFAFATLEFSVELIAIVPLVLCLLAFTDRQLLPAWAAVRKTLGRVAAIFLLTTLVLWPGGWLRGGYFVDYGVLASTVVFKNRAEFGGRPTAAGIYGILYAGHTVLFLTTVLCVVGFIVLLVLRRLSIPTIVFASYSLAAFGLGVADHFRLSNYISEFLLFLLATAGLMFVDLERAFVPSALSRRVLLSAFCAIVAVGCFTEWRQRADAMKFRPWLTPLLSGIRDNVPAGTTVLVTDDWEALWLYLPGYRFEPTAAKNSSEPRSKLRATQASYFLFDGSVPPPPGSSALAVFPTYPGHTEILWKPGMESAKVPQ